MELISQEYQETLRFMHADHQFGKSGGKWWAEVAQMIERHKVMSWLDYGCGGGHLVKNVRKAGLKRPPEIFEYDPGIFVKSFRPKKSSWDLVTCIDVLEHVEPDCLSSVLADLNRLTKGTLFVVVSTRPAGKTLPNGSNAHLIVQDGPWWADRMIRNKFFIVRHISCTTDQWAAILKASP